jgi:hypothetical protein
MLAFLKVDCGQPSEISSVVSLTIGHFNQDLIRDTETDSNFVKHTFSRNLKEKEGLVFALVEDTFSKFA